MFVHNIAQSSNYDTCDDVRPQPAPFVDHTTRYKALHEDLQYKAFFFDYLVYGSADPILQDFEEKKKIKLYIF